MTEEGEQGMTSLEEIFSGTPKKQFTDLPVEQQQEMVLGAAQDSNEAQRKMMASKELETKIVQDGLKFYIEKSTFDIATYKIERIDVTDCFKNAYYRTATKRAQAKKTISNLERAAKKFSEAMTNLGIKLTQAVANINKFAIAYEKARLAPRNKSR